MVAITSRRKYGSAEVFVIPVEIHDKIPVAMKEKATMRVEGEKVIIEKIKVGN